MPPKKSSIDEITYVKCHTISKNKLRLYLCIVHYSLTQPVTKVVHGKTD